MTGPLVRKRRRAQFGRGSCQVHGQRSQPASSFEMDGPKLVSGGVPSSLPVSGCSRSVLWPFRVGGSGRSGLQGGREVSGTSSIIIFLLCSSDLQERGTVVVRGLVSGQFLGRERDVAFWYVCSLLMGCIYRWSSFLVGGFVCVGSMLTDSACSPFSVRSRSSGVFDRFVSDRCATCRRTETI